MGETASAARAARETAMSVTPSKYWVGNVTEVTDATHCRVVSGSKEVPCVVPASLIVSDGATVQVRVRGNDYVVSAVLDGDNQPQDLLDQIAATAASAEAANLAAAAAAMIAQLKITRSTAAPPVAVGDHSDGDQWWQYDATGKVVAVYILSAGAWVPQQLDASEVLRQGTIVTDLLAANAIDGMVITGGIFRSSATATTNGTVQDATGFHGYSSGVEKTRIGSDGKLFAVDATLSGSLNSDGLIVRSDLGKLRLHDYRLGYTPNVYPLTESSYVEFNGGNINIIASFGSADITIDASDAVDVTAAGPLRLTGSYAQIDGIIRHLPATTSSSANAYWTTVQSDGRRRLQVNTSIRAAKKVIEPLDIEPSDVLQLQARSWFDRAEIIEAGLDPDTVTEADCLAAGLIRVPGFIAEEVEAVAPLFATYDNEWLDDGVDGVAARRVLRGVAYDRIPAALLVLLQAQQEQIDTLTARLTALETR